MKECVQTVDEKSSLGYHVVFERGTIVRVEYQCSKDRDVDHGDEVWDGDVEKVDIPLHRIAEDGVDTIKTQLTQVRDALPKDIDNPDILQVIQKAIGILVRDGYPYPGGPPADRHPIMLGECALVFWPHRHRAIFNFVSSSAARGNEERAVTLGGECRRLDGFLFFPYAVIGPDLTVTKIVVTDPAILSPRVTKRIELRDWLISVGAKQPPPFCSGWSEKDEEWYQWICQKSSKYTEEQMEAWVWGS